MISEIIEQTVGVLRKGKTLLYPTDTIWGIGCDARNSEAVEKLYAIKERDHTKSMLVLVENLNNLNIPNHLITPTDRPTTYILPEKLWRPMLGDGIADNLAAADGSLGVRVPRHTFCQEVIRQFGAPLVSTSANLSGRPSPQRYEEIEEELKQRVDFCVPPLPELLSAETRGSRIVKLLPDGTTAILRP